MAASLNYTYNYAFASGLQPNVKKPQLALATSDLNQQHTYFFDGKMRQPRIIADMLLTLSDVVRTHYFLPMPAFTDPVFTSLNISCKNGIYGKNGKIAWINIASYLVILRLQAILCKI